MIAKTRKNKSLTELDGTKQKKLSVSWRAVSSEGDLESDFDTLFQRKDLLKDDLESSISVDKVYDNQDLSNQDFSYQDLSGASFKGCNLTGANFSYANLKDANFSGANLSSVKLKDTDIENAILLDFNIDGLGLEELQALIEYLAKYYPHKLNLLNINLTMLDLRRIDLSKMNLRGVDFRGCDMTGVNILDLDLSSCIITPEQILQALGRPPTALEMHKMFTPRGKGKTVDMSKFGEEMLALFQGGKSSFDFWDFSKEKAAIIKGLKAFSNKVHKSVYGEDGPSAEDVKMHIKRNIKDREKDVNEDKKKLIEEKKREVLGKLIEEKETIPLEQQIEKQSEKRREINREVIDKIRARERA